MTRLALIALSINYGLNEASCKGKVHRVGCSHNRSSPHVRCEKNDFVQTRYLFVFNTQGDSGAVNFQTLLVRPLLWPSPLPPSESSTSSYKDFGRKGWSLSPLPSPS